MSADTASDRFRVLLVGGGVAAVEAVLALRHLAGDRVDVTWVAPNPEFSYRPLAVSAPFGLEPVRRFPLVRFAATAGAVLVKGSLAGIDAALRVARLDDGSELRYDACLLALGARAVEAVPGAITYRTEADVARFVTVLDRLAEGSIRRLAFVVPPGSAWPLPAYELALLTRAYTAKHGLPAELTVLTSEPAPLAVFGDEASSALRGLLEERGISLRTSWMAGAAGDGLLTSPGDEPLAVDEVVALAALIGRPLPGVPHDVRGFVPVDAFGRVRGAERLLAAGDLTDYPLKQGGLATQQADTAAASIARMAGADVDREPFRPVLRGLLLTGGAPRYLRRPLGAGAGGGDVEIEPLWWPPGKIAGRHLAPFLAANLALATPDGPGAVRVDVDLTGRAG